LLLLPQLSHEGYTVLYVVLYQNGAYNPFPDAYTPGKPWTSTSALLLHVPKGGGDGLGGGCGGEGGTATAFAYPISNNAMKRDARFI